MHSMKAEQLRGLLDAQHAILQSIALGADLSACLTLICLKIEEFFSVPQARASILILGNQHLLHGAAPSLDDDYNKQIDGLEIGPNVGSCGAAAYTHQQVIVADIAQDPKWAPFRDLAARHHLRACWSTPIISSHGEVLGTFAIYYSQPADPTPFHQKLIKRFASFASLSIERDQSRAREQQLVASLALSNAKLEGLVGVIPDLVLVLDEHGNYADIYGASKDLLYKGAVDFLGKNVKDILPKPLADDVLGVIGRALSTGEVQKFEYTLDAEKGPCTFDGRVSPLQHYSSIHPNLQHVLWMARDITEQKNAEQHIEQLAFYDVLTNLPNRRLLFDRLELLLKRLQRHLLKVAVLFIDLNDFKRINDSLGHATGDVLLVQVAERLTPLKRNTDTFARIGGDEFVLVIDSSYQADAEIAADALAVCKRLLKALSKPFKLGNGSYKIGASVGICVVDDDTVSAGDILRRADSAMYAAKKLGGNSFAYYDPGIQSEIDRKLKIEREILLALSQQQFCAFFQPQLARDGSVVGAEALVRWRHPELGLISPQSFIPIAENAGLIVKLQNIVLEDACKLLVHLRDEPLVEAGFTVSINLSSSQFRTGKLDENLLKIINKYDVPAHSILLEITESLLMHNKEEAVPQMQKLKALGFRFSVDDFGTGYSSLAYLHELPLDELKIDKSFVDKISICGQDNAIVDSVISLAHHLDLHVVAEGVENATQAELLRKRSINSMQGFYFSRPVSAEDFIHWIKQYRAPQPSTGTC